MKETDTCDKRSLLVVKKMHLSAYILIGLCAAILMGCGGRSAREEVMTDAVNVQGGEEQAESMASDTEEGIVEEAGEVVDEDVDEETIIKSGEWHGVQWQISSQGLLSVTGHLEGGIHAFAGGEGAPWKPYASKINSAYFDFTGAESVQAFFWDCENLTSVDLSNLDTSNLKDMSFLFYNCTGLKEIDLSGLDTSTVTKMGSMFSGCSNLEKINLGGLDTSNVMDMSGMFSNCSSLKEIDLSGWDTSNLRFAPGMFSGCRPQILKYSFSQE